MIDDFLIQYCKRINKHDFVTKTENVNRKRKGKREYLNNMEIREILKDLNRFFETRMELRGLGTGSIRPLRL